MIRKERDLSPSLKNSSPFSLGIYDHSNGYLTLINFSTTQEERCLAIHSNITVSLFFRLF